MEVLLALPGVTREEKGRRGKGKKMDIKENNAYFVGLTKGNTTDGRLIH